MIRKPETGIPVSKPRTDRVTPKQAASVSHDPPGGSDETTPIRPRAMTMFDRLIFVVFAINLAGLLQALPLLRRLVEAEPNAVRMGLTFETVFGQLVGSFLFMLVLWFFTSRLRSNIARWLLTILAGMTALKCVTGAAQFIALAPIYFATSLVSALLGLWAVWFLFTPASRAWFGERRTPAQGTTSRPNAATPGPEQFEQRSAFGRKQT